jgi:hypothetical protein
MPKLSKNLPLGPTSQLYQNEDQGFTRNELLGDAQTTTNCSRRVNLLYSSIPSNKRRRKNGIQSLPPSWYCISVALGSFPVWEKKRKKKKFSIQQLLVISDSNKNHQWMLNYEKRAEKQP